MRRAVDYQGCKDLANKIIDDAIDDIEKNRHLRCGISLRRKHLVWIFKDDHKTFEFWCDAADRDPDAVRKDLKKYKGEL